MNTHDIYKDKEFSIWANTHGLNPNEEFVVKYYLRKDARTLEAGTGAGRIVFALRDLGFTDLHGYDFLKEFVELARDRDFNHTIDFEVQNAVDLGYEDDSFDQILYLQQIISIVGIGNERQQALREAYRILRKEGTVVFSFLDYDIRIRSPFYLPYLAYLKLFRLVKGTDLTLQTIPWLKVGGRFNLKALADKGPYVYWHRMGEFCEMLEETGFCIKALGSSRQLDNGVVYRTHKELMGDKIKGTMYVVCTK